MLNDTDVLVWWWGHKAHDEVSDEVAMKVQKKVQEGMGFVALHSAHLSKPFKLLMGTSCTLKWRKAGEKERLWNIAPAHPITQGIGDYFELEHTEMYGERFDIPKPDEILFLSWFPGGEVFQWLYMAEEMEKSFILSLGMRHFPYIWRNMYRQLYGMQ